MGVANSRELGHLKSELGSVGVREREWEERCGQMRKQVEQLQRENDILREQHRSQVTQNLILQSCMYSLIYLIATNLCANYASQVPVA